MNFSVITETLKVPVDPSLAAEMSGGNGNANGDIAKLVNDEPKVKSKDPVIGDDQKIRIEANSEENRDVPTEEPEVKSEWPIIAEDQDIRIQIEGNSEENRDVPPPPLPEADNNKLSMTWRMILMHVLLSPVYLVPLLLYLLYKVLVICLSLDCEYCDCDSTMFP